MPRCRSWWVSSRSPSTAGRFGAAPDEWSRAPGFSTRRGGDRARRLGSGVILTCRPTIPPGARCGSQISPAGEAIDPGLGDAASRRRRGDHERLVLLLEPNEAFHGFGGRTTRSTSAASRCRASSRRRTSPGSVTPGTPSGILFPNGPTAIFYPRHSSSPLAATGSCSTSHSSRGSDSTQTAARAGALLRPPARSATWWLPERRSGRSTGADRNHRPPASAARMGARTDTRPPGQEHGRDARRTTSRTSTRTSPTSTATGSR